MKIALIHLSDFHINNKDYVSNEKINTIIKSLKVIKNIDKYVLIVSGDIAFSGKTNEYKKARLILTKIINGIKERLLNDYLNVLIVPGNHDLCLTKDARDRETIQKYYDNHCIEELIDSEIDYLSNYNEFSFSHKPLHNNLLMKKFVEFKGYKIQFNLINTAPFSTLKPNDKELHYFPKDKLELLKKKNDCNICVTIMHHSTEWFNWSCKNDLENAIIDNSELLLYGHDHIGSTSMVSLNDSYNMYISSAGSIDFSCKNDNDDSFNVIVLDTNKNTLDGYSFLWNSKNRIFTHKYILKDKKIDIRCAELNPLASYIKEIKRDEYNFENDFTKYFVCPKLISSGLDEYEKQEEICEFISLFNKIIDSNKVEIIGNTNYGKTTLLKYIYISMIGKVTPLFWRLESGVKFNQKNLIKHLFEEQYGDNPVLFEKFQQLDKEQKCIIIDGLDLINRKVNLDKLIALLDEEFGIIIYSTNTSDVSIIDFINEKITKNEKNIRFKIKPFFKEKRNELVQKICQLKNNIENIDIDRINNTIDSVVKNNIDMFSLTPAFIINYTNYFVEMPLEYSAGESVFNKVFEFELHKSMFSFAKKDDVNEILIKFEELAGYMYDNSTESLSSDEIREIINNYNEDYGTKIDSETIVRIGLQSKILRVDKDLLFHFYNKNHLAYFIASYLIKDEQNDKKSAKGISFALKNICFGINSDIILFVSYILNNMKIINSIFERAEELLIDWESLNINKCNIKILNSSTTEISPPTNKEKKEYSNQIEKSEELGYSEETIETTGLFDFNEQSIDELPNKIIRAVKYSEMLAKSLSSFDATMKLPQKRKLINCIYEYPKKIVYAILNPIDEKADDICDDAIRLINEKNKRKRNGEKYTKQDVMRFLTSYSQAILIYFLNHFAELSTSTKTLNLLLERDTEDYCEKIEKLLIIENSGNSEKLLKTASSMISSKDDLMIMMARLIVKKHLLTNKNISFNKKQQLIDKIFGASYRKDFLLGI